MLKGDIIIVGPTSSGKSLLANYIATYGEGMVLNCDSVQVYKDLNVLSNKPTFISTSGENFLTIPTLSLKVQDFEEFYFKVTVNQDKVITNFVCSLTELVDLFLKEKVIQFDVPVNEVPNALFDIKSPLEEFSIAEYIETLKKTRSTTKRNIIAGGTIYYADHYIKGTIFSDLEFKLQSEVDLSQVDYLSFLRKYDPEYLDMVDINNPARLKKAVQYIKQTGSKYSASYIKKTEPLENYILIQIYPKSRENYVKRLNQIVEKRINLVAFNELKYLIQKYGEEIIPWASKISYEYKYGFLIYNEFKKINSLNSTIIHEYIAELQAKERQYTKRQLSFMRRLRV